MFANGDDFTRQRRHETEWSSGSSDEDENDSCKASHHNDDELCSVHSQSELKSKTSLLERVTPLECLDNEYGYREGIDASALNHEQVAPSTEFPATEYRAHMRVDEESQGIVRYSRQSVLQGLSEALMRRSLTKVRR
jgi:hypothetical protein